MLLSHCTAFFHAPPLFLCSNSWPQPLPVGIFFYMSFRSISVALCMQGCYDVGLPSQKSLFQLQAERLLAVQRLAAVAAAGDGDGSNTAATAVLLPWFIMTSPFTHADTV